MKFILLFFASASLWAQDNAKENYQMDSRYKAGNNLIYVCDRRHYACVNNDGWDLCSEAREKDKKLKAKQYSCSPLKKYEEKMKCVTKNYQVVEKNAWKRFCFPK